MNKRFSLMLLLLVSGCTTNNYWQQCRNPLPGQAPAPHPASQTPPAAAGNSPVHSDSKYDRAPASPGGHLMPPPAGSTAVSGEMDPLHFPHFCGPGARQHDAC